MEHAPNDITCFRRTPRAVEGGATAGAGRGADNAAVAAAGQVLRAQRLRRRPAPDYLR